MFRRFKLKKLNKYLHKHNISALEEKFPEYLKKWEEVRIKNPEALSSQDFTFFCYLREAEKIK